MVIKTLDPDWYSAYNAGSRSGINESGSETLIKTPKANYFLRPILKTFNLYEKPLSLQTEHSALLALDLDPNPLIHMYPNIIRNLGSQSGCGSTKGVTMNDIHKELEIYVKK